MAYKSVKHSELMAHEFARVEGAFHLLDDKTLNAVMAAGMKLEPFKERNYSPISHRPIQ
ncbi:hypothetical protein VIBNISOn1_90003 [Vibrio nigripulchritudo SOn1]|uniref:Uncharacterized protein n=1 Tax=Vibrio nigripulchritudo SOn1 TaxID=1238450 RepID=A0AAV2VYG6_9VIBR|nr:hypothetical protein [Vibrio nigripulchritudo]CCO49761.1 hypothetical protein VIBNISOn1_90003 [Vibrio nigripulchritudo SOn1]